MEDCESHNCIKHVDDTHDQGTDGSWSVSKSENREGSPNFTELYLVKIQIRESSQQYIRFSRVFFWLIFRFGYLILKIWNLNEYLHMT